jgi:hypothetical protein
MLWNKSTHKWDWETKRGEGAGITIYLSRAYPDDLTSSNEAPFPEGTYLY